jgi:hypothetical protein
MTRWLLLLAVVAACRAEANPDGGSGSGPGSANVHVTFGGSGSTPLPKLQIQGGLSFEILDSATNMRMPGKLTLLGAKGTKEPRFSKDIGVEIEDSLEAYNRVFSLSGVGVIALPIGTYDITFSRGIEWTIATQRITMTTAGVELHAKLQHVINTPGWVSGDFHVHAAPSPDSRVPMRDRVYEFIADGVDMIVATDHNVVSNYAPVIADMHAEKYLASSTGDEITSGSWGHFGAFPLPHEMETEGHGAIPVKKKSAAEIFAAVRKTAPTAVIDIHHPRLEKGIGYFYLGKFDDQNDRSTRKGFSFDFDAIEVLNGYQDTNRKTIDRVMQDWFALLDRGHIVTATGNSDTHHLDYNLGGYPRNYVLVPNDDPGLVTADDVAKGVKAHHAYFTTGPIVQFHVGTTDIGDLAPAPGGKAKAEITVQASPWISVSRVILYVAGKEVKRWTVTEPVAGKDETQRFHEFYDLDVPKDTYALVRVEGDRSLSPVVGGGKDVTVFPFALTNPIFLDANGNGKYDQPLPHGSHGAGAVEEKE